MPTSENSAKSWTVSTTKRKSRTSEPQAQSRKRRRLSSLDQRPAGAVQKARQQTLTQVQFAPNVSLPQVDLDMLGERSGEGGQKRKFGGRRKSVKRQRSTLTQMDFLARRRDVEEAGVEDEGGGMIGMETGGEFIEGKAGEGKENLDPQTGSGIATEGNGAVVTRGGSKKAGGKTRRDLEPELADDQDWKSGVTKSKPRGRVQREALAEHGQCQRTARSTISSVPRTTRAMKKAETENLRAKPLRWFPSGEKENFDPDAKATKVAILETPKKQRDVIPSSQSPESIPFYSRQRSFLRREVPEGSPLKQRSTIVISTTPSPLRRTPDFSSARSGTSSKRRRICVLKYGLGRLKKSEPPAAELPEMKIDGQKGPGCASSLQGQDPDSTRPPTEDLKETIGSPNPLSRKSTEPEIPETSQILPSTVIPSSQTDTEEDEEIPETSQGLRKVTSISSVNRSEESLQMLSEANHTQTVVKKAGSKESLEGDVGVDGFGLISDGEENKPDDSKSTTGLTAASAVGPRLPAKLPQGETVVSTIYDSQDENDEDFDDEIALNLRTPSTNNARSIENFTSQSHASTSKTPRPLRTAATPGLLALPPVPLQASYPPATTTLIPTKFPASSPLSSSPTLPPSLPPAVATARHRPTTQTQQSIHPASMTRPSQVSTQAPTQPSWLPMSSMPFPNTWYTSSPIHNTGSGDVEHVTVKGSSSQVMPLRDVPSYSQLPSQSQGREDGFAVIDLGLDNARIEVDDDLDGEADDLHSRSSPRPPTLQTPRVKQNNNNNHHVDGRSTRPPHPTTEYYGSIPITHTDTDAQQQQYRRETSARNPSRDTYQGSADKTTNQKIRTGVSSSRMSRAPIPRLRLSDSLLESLPGPPGWVAPWEEGEEYRGEGRDGDWDDEMI